MPRCLNQLSLGVQTRGSENGPRGTIYLFEYTSTSSPSSCALALLALLSHRLPLPPPIIVALASVACDGGQLVTPVSDFVSIVHCHRAILLSSLWIVCRMKVKKGDFPFLLFLLLSGRRKKEPQKRATARTKEGDRTEKKKGKKGETG